MIQIPEDRKMLTTRDVQGLIHVDKSTIYRMAEQGRIPAVKVGRQWRFPADEIEAWLRSGRTEGAARRDVATSTAPRPVHTDAGTMTALADAVASALAEATGTMAMVTDLDGNPIGNVARPCGFYQGLTRHPAALRRCREEWQAMADAAGLEPRLVPTTLGVECARAFIREGRELVGMIIAGGVAPAAWPPSDDELDVMAEHLDVPRDELERHIDDVYRLDATERARLIHLLPMFADVLAAAGFDPATVATAEREPAQSNEGATP